MRKKLGGVREHLVGVELPYLAGFLPNVSSHDCSLMARVAEHIREHLGAALSRTLKNPCWYTMLSSFPETTVIMASVMSTVGPR
jgi:hypothetical protein